MMAEVEEGEVVCELVDRQQRVFDVQLPLKAQLRGRQPFDNVLPSTIITAIIFSFFGRKADVCQMLQILNHRGRSYCVAQEGMPGFLVDYSALFANLSPRANRIYGELRRQRIAGELKVGAAEFCMFGRMGKYTGELNEKGEACGEGTFFHPDGDQYRGMFQGNHAVGFCLALYAGGWITLGEMHYSQWWERATCKYPNGEVYNLRYRTPTSDTMTYSPDGGLSSVPEVIGEHLISRRRAYDREEIEYFNAALMEVVPKSGLLRRD